MKRWLTAVVWCGVALGPVMAQPQELTPFAAWYDGSKTLGFTKATGRARLELQRQGMYLRYTMQTTVRWTVMERTLFDCSVLRIENDRLWPIEYRHVDRGDAEHNVTTRYDWKAGKATTQRGNGDPPAVVNLSGPTWDPMSFQLALMTAASRRQPGATETYQVIERGRIREHRVEFNGAVPHERATVHRVVSHKGDKQTVLLLLASQGWQLQRLTIDGTSFERQGVAPASASGPASGAAPTCEDARS